MHSNWADIVKHEWNRHFVSIAVWSDWVRSRQQVSWSDRSTDRHWTLWILSHQVWWRDVSRLSEGNITSMSHLHTHHSTRFLRLSNTNLLCASFIRTSFGSRSFSIAAPKIWNSLPPALRMCTSHDTFRHQLKTHYFQLAFQPT